VQCLQQPIACSIARNVSQPGEEVSEKENKKNTSIIFVVDRTEARSGARSFNKS
jgi:ABC-type enterochelin transport system substrate-binding protein